MKKFIYTLAVTSIIVMLSASFDAQAQNRRNSSGTSSHSSAVNPSNHTNGTAYSRGGSSTSSTKSSGNSAARQNSTSSSNRSANVRTGSSSTNRNANVRIGSSANQARPVDPQVRRDGYSAQLNTQKQHARDNHRDPSHRIVFSHPFLEPDFRPAPFHKLGLHRFGYRLNTLPRGYQVRYYRNVPYYFYDGIYYRPYHAGGFVVVRPPVGSRITLLDVALTAVVFNVIDNTLDRIERERASKNAKYYYGDGIYYRYDNGEYEVIDAPEGALIEELPEDAEEVELNGKTYYQVEDILYKVVLIEGHPYFEVVARL